jgi:hypothetical protein
MSIRGNEVRAWCRLPLTQSQTNLKQLVVLDCIKKQKFDTSRIVKRLAGKAQPDLEKDVSEPG